VVINVLFGDQCRLERMYDIMIFGERLWRDAAG